MASTSTNKQPLLVDNVIFESVLLTDAITGNDADSNVFGNNSAELLVNCVNTDGAIVEEIRVMSRGTTDYIVNLYMSREADFLRSNVAQFIGRINVAEDDAATPPIPAPSDGQVYKFQDMMTTLVPVPHVGTEPNLKALYVPRGKALWAALQSNTQGAADAPYIQLQGGRY